MTRVAVWHRAGPHGSPDAEGSPKSPVGRRRLSGRRPLCALREQGVPRAQKHRVFAQEACTLPAPRGGAAAPDANGSQAHPNPRPPGSWGCSRQPLSSPGWRGETGRPRGAVGSLSGGRGCLVCTQCPLARHAPLPVLVCSPGCQQGMSSTFASPGPWTRAGCFRWRDRSQRQTAPKGRKAP